MLFIRCFDCSVVPVVPVPAPPPAQLDTDAVRRLHWREVRVRRVIPSSRVAHREAPRARP